MIQAIFSHRSIRSYKTKPIPNNLLERIFLAGTRASSTGNMQVYSMIITQDPGTKQKLWEAHFRQDMVKTAPVHITFCCDFHRFNTWCENRNAVPGYNNFLSFMTGAIDALLASQNVVLEAESNGLGACYLGTATYNADNIIEILDLPKFVVPVAAIVLGYPDEDPPLTPRLPLEAVVHNEKYEQFSPQKIDRVYEERENSDETHKFLEINKKETLAQIFTDLRYKREDNEYFSSKYLETLKNQGFLD